MSIYFGMFYTIFLIDIKGFMKGDSRHGPGTEISLTGNIFNGIYVNDKRDGFGEERYHDGGTYSGIYKRDKSHGYGR